MFASEYADVVAMACGLSQVQRCKPSLVTGNPLKDPLSITSFIEDHRVFARRANKNRLSAKKFAGAKIGVFGLLPVTL